MYLCKLSCSSICLAISLFIHSFCLAKISRLDIICKLLNQHVLTLNQHVLTLNQHVLILNHHVLTLNQHVLTLNQHVLTLNQHVLTHL